MYFFFFLQFRLWLPYRLLCSMLNDLLMPIIREYWYRARVYLEWNILFYAWIRNKIIACFSKIHALILASCYLSHLSTVDVIRLIITSLNRYFSLWLRLIIQRQINIAFTLYHLSLRYFFSFFPSCHNLLWSMLSLFPTWWCYEFHSLSCLLQPY